MQQVPLDEIAGRTLPAADACSLVLAIFELIDTCAPGIQGVPLLAEVQLSGDGRLSFDAPTLSANADDVSTWGALLAKLLDVGDALGADAAPASERRQIPGPLLIATARALGRMDLPPLTLPQFVETLRRYGGSDAATLAAIHARHTESAVGAPPADAASTPLAAYDIGDIEYAPSLVARPHTKAIGTAGAYVRTFAETALGTAAGIALALVVAQQDWFAEAIAMADLRVRGSVSTEAAPGDVPAPAPSPSEAVAHPRVVSPDGRWVAYDSVRNGMRSVYVRATRGGRAIWIADIARTGRERADSPVDQYWTGSWFPDSRRLAYGRDDRLVIASLDRPGETWEIRSPHPGHAVETPAVSPDGQQVLFQVSDEGAWMFDVAERTLTRLGDQDFESSGATTSRDRMSNTRRR